MLETGINIAVVVLSGITTYLAWKCYKTVPDRSLFLFVAGLAFIFWMSVALLIWPNLPDTMLRLGFWLIFPIGMWNLLKTLKKWCRPGKKKVKNGKDKVHTG